MLGKIVNMCGMLSLAFVLALGGFAGYLYGTGKLNAQCVEQIAEVLRGRHEAADADPAPAADAPAPPASTDEQRAPTEEEIRAIKQREHLEMLAIERAARDLEARQRLMDQALQNVLSEQERLAQARKDWEAQRKAREQSLLDAGFKSELATVTAMQPRQAKEYLLRVWERQQADAVRLLDAMEAAQRARVFEQFKTPEELKIMTDLLEQIRLQGLDSNAG